MTDAELNARRSKDWVCRQKVRYRREWEAEKALRALRQKYPEKFDEGLVVYQCRACWGFHLGHPKETKRPSGREEVQLSYSDKDMKNDQFANIPSMTELLERAKVNSAVLTFRVCVAEEVLDMYRDGKLKNVEAIITLLVRGMIPEQMEKAIRK